ncbi:DapH/DapD/GlmU-related protein [Parasediminibacterium paludis]|uniref:DapH/DapD/GlmU-related protein n=1 Tax=Parasediminibacterium paludis TaxID=908966 RepID=A0ABV8Q1K5_9BACT
MNKLIIQSLEKYTFFGIVKLLYSFIRTKLLFKNARLIRFPIDLRGKKYITINDGLTTGNYCRIEVIKFNTDILPSLKIGKNLQINNSVHIACTHRVLIGDDVLIASNVFITDHNHGNYSGNEEHDNPFSKPIERKINASPVTIGNRVWLGEHVCVLPGVTIGDGSIIGASSVVNKNIPPNCIAAGNPAKIIKQFNFNTQKWEIV